MPKFGWKQVHSETFTLNPMGKRYFRLINGKWRLEFHAETAIYTGVMNPQQYAEVLHLKYLPLTAFNNFACHKVSIIEAQTECNVGIPNAVLAIRDKRGPISGMFGLTEGAAGAIPEKEVCFEHSENISATLNLVIKGPTVSKTKTD